MDLYKLKVSKSREAIVQLSSEDAKRYGSNATLVKKDPRKAKSRPAVTEDAAADIKAALSAENKAAVPDNK